MTRGPARRPTLADVARESGMSKAAVSMILNDKPGTRLSAEAAERVRAAAAKLDYRPNPAAVSLRHDKTQTIGFISDHVTLTRYASGMIRGVLGAAKQRGYTVLMTETDRHELADAVELMLDRRVDGILVGLLDARMIDLPEVRYVPLVVINGTSSREHPNVLPDERTAGQAIAGLLIEAGHRRIGLIGDIPRVMGDPRASVTIGERFKGLDGALDAAGIVAVRAVVDDWQPHVGYEYGLRMLTEHPELTAIIALNDNVAFGVYQAVAKLGLRIPDDVSVVSFDDEEVAAYQRPGLTTARLPYEEMAQRGVEMLIGDYEPSHTMLPMPLVIRESVRQLRVAASAGS